MKNLYKFLALAAFASLLIACQPSTEDVCKHVVNIMKKELGSMAEAPSDEDTKNFMAQCVEQAAKEKEKDPAAFKALSACSMKASTLEELAKCQGEQE